MLTDADRQVIEAVSAQVRNGQPVQPYDAGRLEALRLRADGDDLRRIDALLDPSAPAADGSAPPARDEESVAFSRGARLAEEFNGLSVTTKSVTY